MGWLGLLLSLAIFPGSAAAAGWASARAAKHPFIASFLLFVAFVAFGFQAVGYKNERDAGPIHGFLLLPPLAFFLGCWCALIGKFTSPVPSPTGNRDSAIPEHS